MPAKTKEHIPTLIDNNLHNLVVRLQATKAAIKSLDTKKDELTDSIKADAADMEGGKLTVRAEGIMEQHTPSYTISLTDGSNSHIDRDKLLERGVSPEIIAYATNKTSFTQLRIKENKEKKDD